MTQQPGSFGNQIPSQPSPHPAAPLSQPSLGKKLGGHLCCSGEPSQRLQVASGPWGALKQAGWVVG